MSQHPIILVGVRWRRNSGFESVIAASGKAVAAAHRCRFLDQSQEGEGSLDDKTSTRVLAQASSGRALPWNDPEQKARLVEIAPPAA